ncbi:aspartate aminotransferase, mitochondrial-like isoform X2 [Diospyros lotus]|uniref:aspartate aminotransferase, mitochondrial-like isoform X2 n=1 Tax=Diospyros lotus TaxID=55363 RepID=UPI002253CCBC|nr:aspartate aminotransferase, mitochondrial-like isoform X2 [Diospyros lotus]
MWKWKRYLISSRRIRTRRMSIPAANKDPILAVTEAFLADTHPTKINLGVGPYSFRDDEGRPLVFQCVRDAEARIADAQFRESALTSAVKTNLVEESVQLVYGKGADIVKERRFAGVATLSGTSACCLFAEFQHHFYPKSHIYLPVPTWSNHHNIWRGAEVPVRTFHYYHPESKGLNFAALIGDIRNAPDHSFFLLHPCAHNPTGVDPTEEQWREISYQFKVKNHFPFFDMAYQGLASGDLDRDAKAIRIFQEDGHLLGCAQSFTKIMGLYGHRIGCLSILSSDENQAIATRSQLQQIARGMFGSPPIHGSLLVSTILGDPQLKALWAKEVKAMAGRVMRRRATMRQSLEKLDSRCNWEHITNQVGMFCFTGLSPQQVDRLAREFHIYLTPEGRMSMAGVTKSNVDYLANAMHEVTRFGQEDSLQKQQYYSL